MESPFFGNPWYDYTPRSLCRSPIMREVPSQNYDSLRNRKVPVQPQSSRPPKVVSIPVQYAAPERRRSDPHPDAALKIQKAFRGYLVRKNVNKIAGIKREVDEISERVSKKEVAELVRTNGKERLKVVETLMSLLLKLDSVKCADSGVRELRKAVVKKAIALQESVEATVANHQNGGHESAEPPKTDDSEQRAETEMNQRESFDRSSERKKKEEQVEKMVEENKRLGGLVTELAHRNEKQTRLLGSLSQRVEQLERALINERLRRKKRRPYNYVEEFF